MTPFRCHLLDQGDRVVEVVPLDCDGVPAALRQALRLLARRPSLHGVEIWQLERRIFRRLDPVPHRRR